MMRTLKNYEEYIEEQVEAISKDDPNWDFTIKDFGTHRVDIGWGYLDYMEEDECFSLELQDYDEEIESFFLKSTTPDDEMIEGCFVDRYELGEKDPWRRDFEVCLQHAIQSIAYYAHTRY